ncbi:MAG TPA: hypothetical protein VLT33_24510 [Labilithrix sp.]|nr:hypothetical protein [Labilithrix sp.]
MTEPQRSSSQPHPLPDVVDSSDDGDRPSITDVNGSIAKFEMAYSPDKSDRFSFGPPLWARIPGYVFLAFAAVVGLTVFAAYHGSSNSSLYIWVVEGDRHRVFGSAPLAFIILFAAVGNVIKTGLRGVIVTAEGIEARILLAGGFPKVKRWTWAQIDRLVVDDESVMLELWNGEYERLPKVKDAKKMGDLLASIATARGRGVTRLTDTSKS